MSIRKIIKFGKSSHVISLPKEWLLKNSLTKGDTLNLEQTDDEILIKSPKKEPKKEIREITINLDKNQFEKEQIVSAYINNYDTINIIGTNLETYLETIRKTTSYLVALEIIQQTNKKAILKDFLNIKEINLFEIIRRMDRIVSSMFENIIVHLDGEDKFDQIKNKEGDVNRLHYLILKVIRKAKNPQIKRQLELEYDDFIYIFEVSNYLEKIADNIKRIPKFMNRPISTEIKVLFNNIYKNYKETLQAHYKKDKLLALQAQTNKQILIKGCDNCLANNLKNSLILEKMKNIVRDASSITQSIVNKP